LQIPLNFGFGLWKDVSAKVGSHEGDICWYLLNVTAWKTGKFGSNEICIEYIAHMYVGISSFIHVATFTWVTASIRQSANMRTGHTDRLHYIHFIYSSTNVL
jgi:hypothetical protein